MSKLLLAILPVAVVLMAGGCGKSNKEVAKQPVQPKVETTTVAPTTAATPPTTPTQFFPGTTIPPAPVIDPPVSGGAKELLPMPVPVNGGVVAQVPEPKPMPMVPVFPPAVDPKKPDPPVTPMPTPMPTQPSTGSTTPTPKEFQYPKSIDGRDLATWLKEISFDSANIPFQRDAQSREIAIKVLPTFGPTARRPALDPLIRVVTSDPDPNVRIAAVIVLSNMGNDDSKDKKKDVRFAKPAIMALRTRLQSTALGNPERLHIARALGTFGPDAVGAVAELRAVSRDPSFETRIVVAHTLGRIGMPIDEKAEPNDAAVGILMTTMSTDTCASARMEAIQSLFSMGPPKPKNGAELQKDLEMFLKPVVARLRPEMGKPGEKDRCVLCWLLLLNMMYDQDAKTHEANRKQIASYINTPDGVGALNIRVNAINTLAVLGPKAIPVMNEVISALSFDEPMIVGSAISCLAMMGTGAAPAIPHLEKIKNGSKDEKPPVNAPKDWKPDSTLRNVATEAIEIIKGAKKLGG